MPSAISMKDFRSIVPILTSCKRFAAKAVADPGHPAVRSTESSRAATTIASIRHKANAPQPNGEERAKRARAGFISGVVGLGKAAKAAEHCELLLECDVRNLWCVSIASADLGKASFLRLRASTSEKKMTFNR
jgi:hypothetical protein